MSIPRKSEDARSMVEGIVTVRDYGLRCAWQKHMKSLNIEEPNPELISLGVPESSGPAESESSSNTGDLDDLNNQWTDKESCIQYLRTILEENLEYRHYRHSPFLPLDRLFRLLRKPIIKRAFEDIFRGNNISVDQMVSEVGHEKPEHSRLMILATLIYASDGIESLESFIQNQIHDTDLPLRRYPSRMTGTTIQFHKNGDAENSPTMNYLSNRKGGRDFELFCHGQYRYLIPFFDMSPGPVRFYKFDDPQIRLPFTEWYEPTVGGYGIVRRVRIHPAHHNYEAADGECKFAVKEISANFKSYRDEVRALERFSGKRSGHAHLIRLLMALQHDDKYYLVFPLAQGNLVDLWQQKEVPTTPQHVQWVLGQCLGITEGLWNIHHYSPWTDDHACADDQLPFDNRGRHGDIKPENILFFSTPEGNHHLVITDFGLTRFHSALSVSKIAAKRIGGFSRTYRPPEFDMNSPISQAYDMWSLGCVLLEFISWFLIGYKRREFSDARIEDDIPSHSIREDKFFNIHNYVPVVKPSVKNWIHNLRTHEACPATMKDFLDIIENGLLQPNPQDRWKVEVFHDRLKVICDDYKKVLHEPQSSNGNSTIAIFDEKYSVVGHLRGRGPLRKPKDQRRIEWQKKILEQTSMQRQARNSGYGSLDSTILTRENSWTSPSEVAEETGLMGHDTAETSDEPVVEEGIRNQNKTPNSVTQAKPEPVPKPGDSKVKSSTLRSVGEVLESGYVRFKGVLRRLACI